MTNATRKAKRNKKTLWVGGSPGGNYTGKLHEIQDAALPGLTEVDVFHDEWCALLKTPSLPCNCDPIIEKRKD